MSRRFFQLELACYDTSIKWQIDIQIFFFFLFFFKQVSGVQISDVTYQDIHGTSATELAVKFDCSPGNPCSRIRLENVKLTYKNQVAQASCSHAAGTSAGFVQPTSCLQRGENYTKSISMKDRKGTYIPVLSSLGENIVHIFSFCNMKVSVIGH